MHIKAILFLLSVNFIYSQDYTYSIEDINQTSDYYGNYISPSDFSGQVTLHYFGHQNWGTCSARVGNLNNLYNDLIEDGITNVKIIAIGKTQYSNFNNNWTGNNDIPILLDSPPYNAWNDWGAGQRDLFFLDSNGNYTGWNSSQQLGTQIEPNDSRLSIVYAITFALDGSPMVFFEDLFDKDEDSIVAYKVEPLESDIVKDEGEASLDLKAMFALADLAHGEKVFKKCAACHSIKQGGGNKIGPKLWNVMFRSVGAVEDYKYSKSLTSYNKEWNWEEMNGFLIKPSSWIKGNKMGFAGLKDEKDRASVILYLNQNSDNPKPLP